MVAAGDRINAADISTLEDYTTLRPLVRLVASGTQTLADNTQVAITFSAEDIDTHGFHSTSSNTSRVTPTIAGYYRVVGTGFFGAQTTPVVSDLNIRKNGTTNLPPGARTVPSTQAFSLTCSVIVSLDGSTDYVELVMRQDSSGSTTTNQSVQFSCVLELEFLRPL